MAGESDAERWQNTDFLLKNQYQSADKLSARNDLHARFSTNPYGWRRWLFDQVLALSLPAEARILELGAGPGWLWRESVARLPGGWHVTLSDVSPGMVEAAQANLAQSALRARFEVIDIQRIPFEGAHFDLVMAHHMLYHVPDLPAALSEVRRVLKPGGYFLAATNGENHMKELRAFMRQVGWPGMETPAFELGNGAEQLASFFEAVTVERYADGLHITEVEPVVSYALSAFGAQNASPESIEQFRALVQRTLAAKGAFHVSKDSGLFIARRA